MDTFIRSPFTTNTPRKKANVPNERQTSSDSLAETIKLFKILTLQSTINDCTDYHSDENDDESDPKSDQVAAIRTSDIRKRKVTDTDTTNIHSPHKLFINRIIPEIIPVVIPSINQTTTGGVATIGGDFHAVRTIISKDIVTDAARIAAHFSKILRW